MSRSGRCSNRGHDRSCCCADRLDSLGRWNRKALRIPIPLSATPPQVDAIEQLAALASRSWAEKLEKLEKEKVAG